MKYIQSIVMFVAAVGLLSMNAMAQNQKPISLPETQEQKGNVPDEDKVYSPKEVDKKVVIKNREDLDPERFGSATDCRNGARVVVKAIFRKSGEVTDIKVIKPASCSIDKKAAKIISYAKFTPATKNGVAVSQSIEITYEFRKY
ncbi:MAG: TonB family protein [Pyrinomonadaceae bacterium]